MNLKLTPHPEDDPEVLDEVPNRDSKKLTDYDKRNLVTYLKLLDAEHEGMSWSDAARTILKRDPDSEPKAAKITWQQHMDRALWMTREGWRELADDPDEMFARFQKSLRRDNRDCGGDNHDCS